MKNFLRKQYIYPIVLFTSIPFVTEARTIREIARNIGKFLIGPLVSFLLVLSVALFIWGVIDFIRNAENSEARNKGKERIIWGLLALFFMVGFISVTGVFTRTFFQSDPIIPQLYEGK